jgi:hypothetical protein
MIQHVFVSTESLTNLALHTVTVDCMLKTLFRHANQQLDRGITRLALGEHIDSSQRKSSHRLAATASKERLYQLQADYALPLPEPIFLLNHELHEFHESSADSKL